MVIRSIMSNPFQKGMAGELDISISLIPLTSDRVFSIKSYVLIDF